MVDKIKNVWGGDPDRTIPVRNLGGKSPVYGVQESPKDTEALRREMQKICRRNAERAARMK